MADNKNTSTPKKKKTMVALPGSLKNLVHSAQNGPVAEPQPAAQQGGVGESAPQNAAPQVAQNAPEAAQNAAPIAQNAAPVAQNAAADQAAAPAKAAEKKAERKPAQKAHTVVRESTDDSWGLFLDLAREYKSKTTHLSTIYIDPELKTVLDRLRASRDVKMPTAAILSAIVARFIYDNEKRIKDAIYGDRLI